LKAARLKAGLAVRAAARRTHGAISSGRWYQLESGYQRMRGQDIPIGTTAATVIAAAKAVGWDVAEALQVAGFSADEYHHQPPPGPLQRASDDELLAEVRRRMRGERNVLEANAAAGASSQTSQEKEDLAALSPPEIDDVTVTESITPDLGEHPEDTGSLGGSPGGGGDVDDEGSDTAS